MTLLQEVPTDGVGMMAQWSKAIFSRHLVSAGADWRHVDGASLEQGLDALTGTTVTLLRDAGGTQNVSGGFVQGQVSPTEQLSITLSGRVDHWRNYNGRNLETNVPAGTPTAASRTLPDREDTVFSPRAAVLYRVSNKVSAWGSLGSGFRAPTLNELYRQFRVGAILTLANHDLGPERLVGGELGLNIAPGGELHASHDLVRQPDEEPGVQRHHRHQHPAAAEPGPDAHLGPADGRGVPVRPVLARVGAGYLFNQAKVKEFAANPALVGKYLPQVPKNRGSVSVAYSNARIATLSFSVLGFGRQFNEDLNNGVVPGRDGAGPAGLRDVGVLGAARRSVATSTCSSACRTRSTRSTSSSSCPRPPARRGS